ncbi:hypothetical protein RFI_30694 [Reticulomyxa filosa]|uniref:Uncharacterized protein n=1 Tax=Reticulomyxa filosa TaxID=46433 RepID=X6LXM1_RETFI|nr:hypothetical protein RFI_30694 [Reticulomyxa filosa]|eukprot:ETO06698.1 hypothetical protein RFI_30694 [Reticulomyxa filosa]
MNIKIPNNSVSNGNKKEQLEYREKVLSLIRKADDKRLSKRKGLTEAYQQYYIDDVRENIFFSPAMAKKAYYLLCGIEYRKYQDDDENRVSNERSELTKDLWPKIQRNIENRGFLKCPFLHCFQRGTFFFYLGLKEKRIRKYDRCVTLYIAFDKKKAKRRRQAT